ncbi:MAG TPA: ribonuclease activity regulator RraA [Kouleothrix sp.]|uniref:ribonuclease activity regulator RraA n=1 Tax=Kouleothrix sp. TaxID=2779161 RepID=UPI002B715303|nr:ribonuclease activity regulator RraA [Kouleothrix sp.]HRC75331.1 ribonuclease activity regulator RraA [Kouleothrix sp.]
MRSNPEDLRGIALPAPGWSRALPISGPPFERPAPELIERLYRVGSATASAVMHRMGVRQTFVEGPVARQPGAKVVGPVVTLQFMPQREDVASGLAQEHAEQVSALWAVFESVQPGDVLAVQAFGDAYTGCMGEMLITYFKGRGGVGIVVDGCIRDWPRVREIGVPLWTRGFTPNYASQASLFPWAYNVPIACSRVLALPGDIMIADDDGAVLVPAQMAELVLQHTLDHEEWEVFSRIMLAQGGSLAKYYPLSDEGWAEYEAWRKQQGQKA